MCEFTPAAKMSAIYTLILHLQTTAWCQLQCVTVCSLTVCSFTEFRTKQSTQVPLTVRCYDARSVFRIDRQSYRMANVVFLAIWLGCLQLVANPVYIY